MAILHVKFDSSTDNPYPLCIRITDHSNKHISLYVRRECIAFLFDYLVQKTAYGMTLICMNGDYVVQWLNSDRLSFRKIGLTDSMILTSNEVNELSLLIKNEMSCPSTSSESDPMLGAKQRTNDNLSSVFG